MQGGTFDRRIGRQGGGPGEYRVVAALQITRQGLLLVHDPSALHITFFRPDGSVRHEVSLVRSFDWRGFTVDSAGRYYVATRLPGPLEGPLAREQFVRLAPEGALLDSLPHPPETTPPGTAFALVTTDGMRSSFALKSLVAPCRLGGMVSARPDVHRFAVTDPGRRPLVVARPFTPEPLGRAERAVWLTWTEHSPRDPRTGRRYSIARLKPAIRDFWSDHQGRIWVEVYVAAEQRAEPPRRAGDGRPLLTWKHWTTYDVFSPEGRYLGRLRLPPESVILAVRDSRVYLESTGPEGEQYVGVYRRGPRSRRQVTGSDGGAFDRGRTCSAA